MSDSKLRPKRRKTGAGIARKGGRRPAGEGGPPTADSPAHAAAPSSGVCLRCGMPGPVGEDGFCAACEKALEQACL